MRAIRIREAGASDVLELVERERPAVPPSHVRVRVAAFGVNRADILQRQGRYPAPPGAPADIPGLEYAGEVVERGSLAVRFEVGDAVMGLVAGGGYAEEVVVHEREVLRVPAGMDLVDAAAIPEVFLTGYDALRQLGVCAGDRVLVHAVGSGVGTAAIQLLAWMGASSVGTSRTPSKLKRALEFGLGEAVHVDDPGAFANQFEPVNAVVDLVGGAYFQQSLRSLAPRGRLLIVGLTAGVSSEMSLAHMLRYRLTVTGTNLRSRPIEEKIELVQDFDARVSPLLGGRLKPVIDRVLPAEEVARAHEVLESNTTFGKVILQW